MLQNLKCQDCPNTARFGGTRCTPCEEKHLRHERIRKLQHDVVAGEKDVLAEAVLFLLEDKL